MEGTKETWEGGKLVGYLKIHHPLIVKLKGNGHIKYGTEPSDIFI